MMPLKIIGARNSKTQNLYVRGSYLGVAVDKSCRTNKQPVANAILKRIEGQIERGEYPPKIDHLHISGEIEGEIYVIGFGDYVKIGFTSGPLQNRLATIQTGCPEPLVVYASIPGAMRLERELHRRFAASRLEGEWFRKTPELLGYIEQIKKPSAARVAA
jgi:hypothetical protein